MGGTQNQRNRGLLNLDIHVPKLCGLLEHYPIRLQYRELPRELGLLVEVGVPVETTCIKPLC